MVASPLKARYPGLWCLDTAGCQLPHSVPGANRGFLGYSSRGLELLQARRGHSQRGGAPAGRLNPAYRIRNHLRRAASNFAGLRGAYRTARSPLRLQATHAEQSAQGPEMSALCCFLSGFLRLQGLLWAPPVELRMSGYPDALTLPLKNTSH